MIGIESCCGTTCDKSAVKKEFYKLQNFQKKIQQIVRTCERIPIGKLKGGMTGDLINNKEPIAITRYGNADAFLIPGDMLRELFEEKQR